MVQHLIALLWNDIHVSHATVLICFTEICLTVTLKEEHIYIYMVRREDASWMIANLRLDLLEEDFLVIVQWFVNQLMIIPVHYMPKLSMDYDGLESQSKQSI
jgi:hypothetical protein